MIRKTFCALALATVTGLTACNIAPTTQTYWVNPRYSPETQRHRFTLDSTECVALAERLIPRPPPPPPQPQAQSGSITLHTPSGPVSGSYYSDPPLPPSSSAVRLPAPVEGELMFRREQARQEYAAACMTERGWEQRVIRRQ